MKSHLIARVAFGYLFLLSLELGVWALFAPRSFYDGFPGLGRTWASIDGPYNEHLLRDFGALNLALAVVLLSAAVTLRRSLVVVASAASLVWGVPHLLYHLVRTDGYSASDLVISLGGLVLFVVIPIGLILARDRFDDASPRHAEAQPVRPAVNAEVSAR